MSHGFSPVSLSDVPRIVTAKPLAVSLSTRFVFALLVVIGILGFLQELFVGEPKRAWMTLQINFTYWLCVAAASSCFAAVFHVCNAEWARPIKRIFESAILFFSWLPAVLIVLFIGHHHLFIWSNVPTAGKETWLTSNFVYGRDLVGLLLLGWISRKVIHASVRRDVGAIRSGLTGVAEADLVRWKDKRYDHYVTDWSGDTRAELGKATDTMGRLSPVVIMIYALVMSLIAFDQIMSVDPHWYSTLFGAFYFMSAVYVAVAFAAMGVGMVRSISPLFLAKIERRTLHDLGKLLLGFGIFWAYMFWSHYLTIWYANMPEETGFLIERTREQPWHSIAWMVLGSCFIIPFLLGLSRDLKQVPSLLFATGAIVAVGVWLFMYILFAPTLYPKELPFSLNDLAVAFGFLGAYVLSAERYLSKVPLMPFGDLYEGIEWNESAEAIY